jgi:hypothetical protein
MKFLTLFIIFSTTVLHCVGIHLRALNLAPGSSTVSMQFTLLHFLHDKMRARALYLGEMGWHEMNGWIMQRFKFNYGAGCESHMV